MLQGCSDICQRKCSQLRRLARWGPHGTMCTAQQNCVEMCTAGRTARKLPLAVWQGQVPWREVGAAAAAPAAVCGKQPLKGAPPQGVRGSKGPGVWHLGVRSHRGGWGLQQARCCRDSACHHVCVGCHVVQWRLCLGGGVELSCCQDTRQGAVGVCVCAMSCALPPCAYRSASCCVWGGGAACLLLRLYVLCFPACAPGPRQQPRSCWLLPIAGAAPTLPL